jgi:replicative DNA helicase
MEMSSSQVATRMLGSIARVDQHKMRTGKLNDEEGIRPVYPKRNRTVLALT